MYLIKILGNDKTNNLCFNFRYNTIGVAMNDKAQVDDILALINDINQPITMNLASILQLACQFATDTEVVSHLLSLNANPNYLLALKPFGILHHPILVETLLYIVCKNCSVF